MSSRHHIPFPKNFLSLNTPVKKTTRPTTPPPENITEAASAPAPAPVEPTPALHTFLSNRPTTVAARHESMSSVSSAGSVFSEANGPASPTSAIESPELKPEIKAAVPNFLALNTKYAQPEKKPVTAEPSPFLSNRV